MKRSIVFLISFILLFSCEMNKERIYYSSSFVLAYKNVNDIRIEEIDSDGNVIVSVCWSEVGDVYSFDEEDDNFKLEKYCELCQKHNDILPSSKKRKISYRLVAGGFQDGPCAPDIDFKKIEITSVDDYDATHKAGNSLNDIVGIVAVSPYNHINSGYKEMFDYSNATLSENFKSLYHYFTGKSEYFPIEKKVSELLPEEMILIADKRSIYRGGIMSSMFYLCFEQPATSYPQHITVEITTDDGRTFVSNELEIQ